MTYDVFSGTLNPAESISNLESYTLTGKSAKLDLYIGMSQPHNLHICSTSYLFNLLAALAF